ncbi:MAG TPA: HAD hydrolase family protein [Vicinamibacterales bacterium]|nr:HAD hydrolase family protein [Vicinamibacterales bacterium]
MRVSIEPLDPALTERLRLIRLVAFDFDGVFTDNAVYVSQDGTEAVRCVRSDGIGLQTLTALGIATLVISTETNPVVGARSRKLSLRCIQGCDDKLAALESVLAELGLTRGEAAFVGNDINDLECLEAVGLPIVVADAHDDVIPHAVYRTKTRGGHGAVREVCDLIAAVRRG